MNIQHEPTIPKRNWVKWGLWLLLASLPIAYFASVVQRAHEFIAEAELPGGMYRLQLLQVTDGKLDYEWSDPLRSLRGFSMLGVRFVPGTSIPPIRVHLDGRDFMTGLPGSASFLFRIVDQKGRFASPPGYHRLRMVFRDSNGFVYVDSNDGKRFGHLGAIAFTVSALPRRDRELNIVVATEDSTELAELKIPNPFFVESPPVWTAESLPSEKRSKHISATLTGLCAQQNKTPPFLQQSTDADVSYTDDEVAGEQFLHSIKWFEDPCGNKGRSLSPFEKVWKVRAQAHRPAVATFPAEQIVNLGSLTIPEPGKLEVIERRFSRDGIEFTIACLSGGGTARRDAGKWSSTPPDMSQPQAGLYAEGRQTNGVITHQQLKLQRPFLWIECESLPQERKLLARYMTASGWTGADSGSTASIGNVQLVPAVLPTVRAGESVEIEVIVSKAEEFEFYVEPPRSK